MLTQVESQPSVIARESAKVVNLAAGEVRTLAAGEVLFREGDPRNYVYRVETGALCLFKLRADGSENVIEFAFPGDLVGIGYLDSHATGAQASIETQLSCLPRTGVDPLAAKTPVARAPYGVDRARGGAAHPVAGADRAPGRRAPCGGAVRHAVAL